MFIKNDLKIILVIFFTMNVKMRKKKNTKIYFTPTFLVQYFDYITRREAFSPRVTLPLYI